MTDLTEQYLGRYYLVERLGEGGMAVVYKGYDTRLERDVAVKIIRSGVFPPDDLEQVLKRFEREAKALAKLSHLNIVKVYDYGEHDGSPYLVMEYLPGGTLKKLLGKPVPWQDAVRLILPVARGVAYAHQRGILHRDIKPANVLITDSGEPMLSDFGIAKLFEGDQATALTGSGMAIGTPEYMAPEQWTGVTSPQSDQYSLGIVLYEMVAGRKPYVADTPGAILIKQVTEPLPGPRKFVSELPETLEHILIKSLTREPANRYKDINAFIGALENLHVGTPVVTVTEPEIVEPTSRVQIQEPVVSVPTQLSSWDDGETVKVEEPRESQKVEEATFVPPSVVRHPPSVKLSRKAMGLLFGGVVLVAALWLGSSAIEKWFSPVSVSTARATSTLDLVLPSHTLEVLLPSETPTLELIPADVSSPTPTPLPTEIVDEKGVEMVLVPAGEFMMGSDSGASDEKPVHQVYLDAFYVDKFEVTNSLYKVCVNAGMCDQPAYTDNYNNSQYAQHPVVYVDWNMAKEFCEWRGARLSTEAEWEKAARGTDGRTYPWGEEIDSSYANYNQNIGDTSPVGDYPNGISPYGAYDMAGNAWEWVADWYDSTYYEISPAVYPQGPSSGKYRGLRGGSWGNIDDSLRSTFRGWLEPTNPLNYSIPYGFRCALSVASDMQPVPAETPTPKPETFSLPTEITDDKGADMVFVPEGEFIMGSEYGYNDEKPVHEVYLDSFYIDKYEVTNAFYRICVAAGVCNPPRDVGSNTRSSYYANSEFDDYPVIFMNWDQATTYCQWRGAELPTEAEWEKASRGTNGSDPWWKDDIDCGKSKYFQCTNDTAKVGSYADGVSPYGAYDMVGNVWEWVSDWYYSQYYSVSPASNPQGPSTGKFRALRGGFYFFNNHWFNSGTARSGNVRSYIYDYMIGFRCAKPLP